MKLYTKAGDGGHTQLLNGQRVRKDHLRVCAHGDVDELNTLLGWARSLTKQRSVTISLELIQNDLFVLGAGLSIPLGKKKTVGVPLIAQEHVTRLEKEIDQWTDRLPTLKNFILPGGSPLGAVLHLARAVSRRAERSVVALMRHDQSLLLSQIYLNRLSDHLFVLARWSNHLHHRPETLWKAKKQ